MNDKINSTINVLPPFKNFCMTIGELPASYLETMSYYESLLWFTKYLKETVIPTINNNAEAVSELQDLFVKLQNYVNNYFDNLDVQEEINNKLDEMVEDGTLQNILNNYANITKVFNTMIDLMQDENLVPNEKVKTLGYYEINDGGQGEYYIREKNNSDIDDGGSKIIIDNVVAELIIKNNTINVKQFGAKGDANYWNNVDGNYYVDSEYNILANDDTSYIKKAIAYKYITSSNLRTDEITIVFPNAKYLINETLYFTNNQDIDFDYSQIIPKNNFNGTFMIATNVSEENHNTWKLGYPHRHAFLRNAKPVDYNRQGIGFVRFGDTRKIENILSHYMGYIAHSIHEYIDNIFIENINIYDPVGGNYQIECLQSNGDGGYINMVHVYGSRQNAETGDDDYCNGTNQFYNLINISNHQMTISNCINGRIRLNVGNYNINNFHCEHGQIILENCEASISNSLFVNHPENYSNIYVVNTHSTGKSGFSCLLENCGFFVEPHLYNYDNTLRADIDISNSSGQVTIINCYRRQLTSYYPEYYRYRTLPIVKIINDEIYYCRNQIEKFLNGNANDIYECVPSDSHSISRGLYTDTTKTYNGDLGATTYNIYELYDMNRQLATSLGTTTSIDAVTDKLIFVQIEGLVPNSLVYIEKLVDNKIYYAILPLMLGNRITDYGKNICGIPWTLTENSLVLARVRSYKKEGKYVTLRNTTLPSTGNWQDGDKIYHYEPEASTQWKLAYNTNTGTPSWTKYDYTVVD